MKLAEFDDLCQREWDRSRRGDVVSVSLTEASYEELGADIHASAPRLPYDLQDEPCACHPHVIMSHPIALVNPVTRTQVGIRVKASGAHDTARVRVMGGTCRETWWPATA